jgi:ADP-heptose:LPS heptosyltransferase
LVKKLKSKNYLPVWIGAGAADQQRVDGIRSELGEEAGIDLCGQLSLVELLSLMQRACCFVGSDSGPMHLAASIDLPLVALFGPSREAIWAPLGANSLCLRGSESCAEDCDAHHCRFHYRCLRSLAPEAVFDALPLSQAAAPMIED